MVQSSDASWKFEDIVWKNVAFFVYLHLGSAYGIYQVFTGQCKIATVLMGKFWIETTLMIKYRIDGIVTKVTYWNRLSNDCLAALLIHWGLLGITAGAHRLWSHKAYKAKWPLKLILTFFNTIAHQNGIWVWVHDHRVHHKFQDSHADPHNAGRGLFFSHFGWLMVRERPEVDEKRHTIDMSDCIADPFVMIQKK